jgi:hypothetical protein
VRRALALLLLLAGACSAPVPAPRPAPAAAKSAAPPPTTLELDGTREATRLTRRSAKGEAVYAVSLGKARQVIDAPDGGAFAVVEEQSGYRVSGTLVRIDALGAESWRARGPDKGWSKDARLLSAAGWVFVIDGKVLYMVEPKGRIARSVGLADPVLDADQRGGVLAIADENGVARLSSLASAMWRVKLHAFPTTDPSSDTAADRRVAVSTDGTVLTGASDGSLVALDPEGQALFQLGVRGAVTRIEARADGDFVVFSAAGIATTLSARGEVRGEAPASAKASRLGVIDLRKDGGESAAAPLLSPTLTHRAHRQGLAGTVFHDVVSVLPLSPSDVWALVRGDTVPGKDPPPPRLFHREAAGWVDLGVPSVTFAKEVYAVGEPAAAGTFTAELLARGPGGALLVLGTRGPYPHRPCVLERTSAGLRERRDLLTVLSKLPQASWATSLSYASSAAGHELLCDGDAERCIELGRDLAPRLLPIGEGKRMPEGIGERRQSTRETPVLFAGETPWKARGLALGEAEVWGIGERALVHWNGSSFDRRETPLGALESIWASGRDDVWVTGKEGVARFDGERWWRVLEIDDDPRNEADGPLSVIGSGRGDVWAYGRAGLWQITPDAQAQSDLQGERAPAPAASAPSGALLVHDGEPPFHLERVTLDVDGEAPLRSALSIAEGPGGLLWLHDGVRLVEYDGTHARVLQRARSPVPFVCWSAPENDCEVCVACTRPRPAPVRCQRCAAPLAAGQGAMLAEEGLLSITGGRPAPELTALSSLVAAAASPTGAIWAVSARRDDTRPHAIVIGPRGLRLVAGLPPAAYVDVAARADDDLWLTGGLSSDGDAQPTGEGTLVHFDGKAFTRRRGPEGALLAVAATGPGEAWAVGVHGGVLHARGDGTEALHLEREGDARLTLTLRAVAARGAEAWMAGDEATLLHWDGKALQQVSTRPAGTRAVLTTVIAPGAGPGWVAGPGGIWKLVRGAPAK